MPTLLECMATQLGISVDDLVGTTQIKADVLALQNQASAQNSANVGLFNSLGAQIVNLQAQIDAFGAASITQVDLDNLQVLIQAQIDGILANLSATNSNLIIAQNRITVLEGVRGVLEGQVTALIANDNVMSDRIARLASNIEYTADADFTAEWLITPHTTRLTTALTATRTLTLSATNAEPGARLRFVYSSTVGFNWNVGPGIKTMNPATWAEFEWDEVAAAWFLSARGNL